MVNYCIYKIISPSEKLYIGQTCNFSKRYNTYKTTNAFGQPKLRNSFLKYGIKNHKFEILIENLDNHEINPMENFYIKYYKCVTEGLNCSYDATSPMKNRKHSIESKNKMSLKRKGKKFGIRTEEHKKNLKKAVQKTFKEGRIGARKGVVLSVETKDKLKKVQLGRIHSDNHKLKVSLNHGSRKLSMEQVIDIKNRLINGEKRMKLVKEFGVCYTTIRDIYTGQRSDLTLNIKNLISPR